MLEDAVMSRYFKKIRFILRKKIAVDIAVCSKWTLGVHRKTSNLAVWGDTGRYPLTLEALKPAPDFFYRLESPP